MPASWDWDEDETSSIWFLIINVHCLRIPVPSGAEKEHLEGKAGPPACRLLSCHCSRKWQDGLEGAREETEELDPPYPFPGEREKVEPVLGGGSRAESGLFPKDRPFLPNPPGRKGGDRR